MKKAMLVLLSAALCLNLAACSGGSPASGASGQSSAASAAQAGGDVIKIGVSGPMTGSSAEGGLAENVGIQMAIDEVNAAGGITIDGKPHTVQAIYYDSESSPEVGVSNCEKLVTVDKVDFLFCETMNSSVGIATMEIATKYDVVTATLECVSSAISAKVAKNPEAYKYFFKFGFDSTAYGNTMANTILQFAESGEISAPDKTVSMIGEETDYGRSNLNAAKALLEEAGYTVVTEDYVDIATTDFYSILSNVKSSGANVLLSCFTSSAAGAALVKQYTENGLTIPHMAIYYPSQSEFTDQIGSMAEGLLWTPLFLDLDHNERHQEFAKKLDAYNGDTANLDNMQAYDCMSKVLQAMKNAGTLEPAAFSGALLELKHEGYSGTYVFSEDTHTTLDGEGYVEVMTAQIQDGKNIIVWPSAKATGEYIAKK